jgi:hypothetical protein
MSWATVAAVSHRGGRETAAELLFDLAPLLLSQLPALLEPPVDVQPALRQALAALLQHPDHAQHQGGTAAQDHHGQGGREGAGGALPWAAGPLEDLVVGPGQQGLSQLVLERDQLGRGRRGQMAGNGPEIGQQLVENPGRARRTVRFLERQQKADGAVGSLFAAAVADRQDAADIDHALRPAAQEKPAVFHAFQPRQIGPQTIDQGAVLRMVEPFAVRAEQQVVLAVEHQHHPL